jgi:hypothetical protein
MKPEVDLAVRRMAAMGVPRETWQKKTWVIQVFPV